MVLTRLHIGSVTICKTVYDCRSLPPIFWKMLLTFRRSTFCCMHQCCKIYDKRDDFNFEIVNFPFLDGDVPRSPSYGVYVLRKVRIWTIPESLCAK